MKQSRSQEIRVGIITVLAVIATVGAILWGKGIGIGTNKRSVAISFADASGVDQGTAITIRGIRKGEVTAVTVRQKDVLVTATVDITGTMLHRDASAQLLMLELTGGKKIELDLGSVSAPLPDNAEIPGNSPADIGKLLSKGDTLVAQVSALLQRLDTTVSMANSYLGDPSLKNMIYGTLRNANEASGTLNSLLHENRKKISSLITSMDVLSRDLGAFFNKMSPKLETTLTSVDQIVADAKSTMKSADDAMKDADVLVKRIDAMIIDIKEGKGTISKLLYDKEFADDLTETLKNAKVLVEQVKKYGINTNVTIGRLP